MKKSNKLIAEFMGRRGKTYPNLFWVNIEGVPWVEIKEMRFHNSWDWLMPVVMKISVLKSWTLSATIDWLADEYCGGSGIDDLEEMYDAVVKHLKEKI